MAINLNCNLNGGDTVTPNNELFYRIYGDVDAYASPIHTTGTALADANVSVDGDVVDILNVDETTNTTFKISAVDASGNEGVLSDAVSSALAPDPDNIFGNQFFEDSNTDGLADDLTVSGTMTTTIVTGNGHIGNAQRMVKDATNLDYLYLTPPPATDVDVDYQISFLYRGSKGSGAYIKLAFVGNKVVSDNLGDAIEYSEVVTAPTATSPCQFYPSNDNAVLDSWLEISNLVIKAV